ncbi:MAG TPA: DarT ssDNA thymidine ADP-ribosyltransferase family protein [Candidatus Acidoferrales bacterium]|nr:DarT ssDNA thymidine ADP-ribosyltransferase family protein [Candidatus Acidoferrales bacterium]
MFDRTGFARVADCYNDLKDLDSIDWDLFHESPRMDGYCKYWNSRVDNPRYIRRKETRQAEFLVHEQVPVRLMNGIGVYNAEKAADVRKILDKAEIDIPVEVKAAWYF